MFQTRMIAAMVATAAVAQVSTGVNRPLRSGSPLIMGYTSVIVDADTMGPKMVGRHKAPFWRTWAGGKPCPRPRCVSIQPQHSGESRAQRPSALWKDGCQAIMTDGHYCRGATGGRNEDGGARGARPSIDREVSGVPK